MILNKAGEQYIHNEITYKIGGEVFVVDEGPYEGLIGMITEIRDGEDKETDNDTVDIYCDFDLPAIRCERERLVGRFSILCGKPMTLEEINFEQVIMAPEMICSLEDEHKDTDIYILTGEWCSDSGCGRDILVLTDLACTDRKRYCPHRTTFSSKSGTGVPFPYRTGNTHVNDRSDYPLRNCFRVFSEQRELRSQRKGHIRHKR